MLLQTMQWISGLEKRKMNRSFEIKGIEFDERGNVVYVAGTYNRNDFMIASRETLTAQDIIDSI